MKYLHASCLSLPITTFVKVIKNEHFLTWPDLTTDLILNHLPKSMYIYQSRLITEKQGLQSTNPKKLNTKMIDV